MIETVASVELPAGGALLIQKNRILPADASPEKKYKRICIVTGTHGDELEGQYVCYELARRINESPEDLDGIVDIYPAVNPFAIAEGTRKIPYFAQDMNRRFPGRKDGDMYDHLTGELIRDLLGADLVIDIHASNQYLQELPQIRISRELASALIPHARNINVDLIWVQNQTVIMSNTLAATLNHSQTPTLVVEMGIGQRIHKDLGDQLVDGILTTMSDLKIWHGRRFAASNPYISFHPRGVEGITAPASGMFVRERQVGENVSAGQLIGSIVDPLSGKTVSKIVAENTGLLFTIRQSPLVQTGALLGRILVGARR